MSFNGLKQKNKGNHYHKRIMRAAFSATVYFIWQARNKIIFTDVNWDNKEIIKRIKYSTARRVYQQYEFDPP